MKTKRIIAYTLTIFLLSFPTFARMLRYGIYSTQDFHYFRLREFDKCIQDLQLPCRWAPDAGFGYGEPLFNFYGQLPYAIGELFHLLGFSLVNSLKLLFIISLVASGLTMFFLARQIWRDNFSAVLSSILYIYAPYRAIDIWVRGALPEALGFILFPLILLALNSYIEKKRPRDLLWFSLMIALLILTHNLSLLLFMPIMIIWIFYKLLATDRRWITLGTIIAAMIFSCLIAAFYVLPMLFEAKYITLDAVKQGYFDFRGHFAGLSQLLISRFWGYGASVFGPEDELSLSVGHLQWILPLFVLIIVFIKRELTKYDVLRGLRVRGFRLTCLRYPRLNARAAAHLRAESSEFSPCRRCYKQLLVLIAAGWFLLFLTHNKSTFLWKLLPPLAYIQFPWRFLAAAVFCFALAAGALPIFFQKYKRVITIGFIILAIILNVSFFREDIWYRVGDSELLSGKRWNEQTAASIGDYWPVFGKEKPVEIAPDNPEGGELVDKMSNKIIYKVTSRGEIQFPVVYFPGWRAEVRRESIDTYPSGNYGLITAKVAQGENIVTLRFVDTPIRTIGNIISVFSIIVFGFLFYPSTRRPRLSVRG